MSQSRKDQIKSCLMRNVAKLKVPVTIGKYYGRLGNNVQQIALAILYGELHQTGVIIPEHSLIEGFRVNVPRLWPRQFALRNRFYYYHEPDGFPSDIELDYPHSLKNIRRIAHKHIFPNLKLKAVVPLPDDVLVIHLRGGDIFETTKAIQDNYIQNPLS